MQVGVTVDFHVSPPSFSLCSWRICILCFVPATMISSPTGSEGMEMSKSLLARADASFTCSWDTVADAVVVLSRIVVQDAIAGVGTCVLVTRCFCTLSLIFSLNERGVHISFCGKVGCGLVSRRRFIDRGV